MAGRLGPEPGRDVLGLEGKDVGTETVAAGSASWGADEARLALAAGPRQGSGEACLLGGDLLMEPREAGEALRAGTSAKGLKEQW
jgi:hypothetical protein